MSKDNPLFKAGDELYYVNPVVFIIDKVLISFIDTESEPLNEGEENIVYYIEHSGAYLAEHHLFRDLDSAKQVAMSMLNDFYARKFQEIVYSNPELDFEAED